MKRALIYIAAAAGCVAAGGLVIGRTMHLGYGHAVYCALGTAATVGCDATPATTAARLASAAVIVVSIPLFALAYGSLSSAHLRKHMAIHRQATVAQVRAELDTVRQHVTTTVGHATQEMHRRMDGHADLIRAVAADAQVNAGAGSNPAQGLTADQPKADAPPAGAERVVPPAAASTKGRRRPVG